MPHVIIKMYAGRSDAQKAALAEAVTQAVIAAHGCKADAVSVGIEDVAASDWTASVYEPDIVAKATTIYKKPGYDPRSSSSTRPSAGTRRSSGSGNRPAARCDSTSPSAGSGRSPY